MNEFLHPIAILPIILCIMGTGALIILAAATVHPRRHNKIITIRIKK